MSPRRNWDSPNPSPTSKCALPPDQRVGGHTRLQLNGRGSPNSDDWRKSLALCLLSDRICSFYSKGAANANLCRTTDRLWCAQSKTTLYTTTVAQTPNILVFPIPSANAHKEPDNDNLSLFPIRLAFVSNSTL
jgi:hypothetical protein